MSSRKIAYVDLQVNGYHGLDFNGDQLSAESLNTACQQLEADGVAGILATITTDTLAANDYPTGAPGRSARGRSTGRADYLRHSYRRPVYQPDCPATLALTPQPRSSLLAPT